MDRGNVRVTGMLLKHSKPVQVCDGPFIYSSNLPFGGVFDSCVQN